MPSTDKAVVVDGIRKTFGSVVALQDICFESGAARYSALLGPNGAGKTTMVDILSTLTRPDRGHAAVAGHDVLSDPAGVRRSIMVTGQHVALDDMLTGRENLVMFGRLQGLKKSQARSRAKELLDQFDLADAADRRVSTYSGGMRRRIDIACGLVVRPEVVFLDEPTTGLDPRSRQSIWELVSDFKEAGIATLLTTQYLEEADALSDRIIVIDHGSDHRGGNGGRTQGACRSDLLRNRPPPPEGSARRGRGAGFAVAGGEPGGVDNGIRSRRDARPRRPEHPDAGPVPVERGEHRVARHRPAAAVARRGVYRADNSRTMATSPRRQAALTVGTEVVT